MSIADRYQAYAEAFESSYEDDDWSRLEQYFTEDAVYEGGDQDARGRDAVLAKLKGGVDGFDRRMDSRTPDFQTPTVDGDTLTMKWTVDTSTGGFLKTQAGSRISLRIKVDQQGADLPLGKTGGKIDGGGGFSHTALLIGDRYNHR